MKLALFLTTAAALIPASAQVPTMKQPNPAVAAARAGTGATLEKPAFSLQTIGGLEKELDGRISGTGGSDPCVVPGGGTRGFYVNGLGMVLTADVDLVNSPGGIGLMQATVSAPQKAAIRQRKLAHVPLIEQTMRDMILSISASSALKLADSDQVIVAVRLVYRYWEDTKDLPGQIVMRLDRRGGSILMEVQ